MQEPRAMHTNLLVLWLLLGFMGATFYAIPEETQSELAWPKLAIAQLVILVATGVVALVGFLFGWTQGRPLLEIPRPLDLAFVIGALMFLANVGVTILRARRFTATQGSLLAGLVFLALLYLFGRRLVLLVVGRPPVGRRRVGARGRGARGVHGHPAHRRRSARGREVALRRARPLPVHWHRRDRPPLLLDRRAQILAVGGRHLLGARAAAHRPHVARHLEHMRDAKKPLRPRLTWVFLFGMAVLHFLGAGAFGFAHTLPQINYYTHGSQVTVSHGHLAFYGAYALLNLSFFYFATPRLRLIFNSFLA